MTSAPTTNNFAVIFDLDGVLVDTSEFHKQSWLELADQNHWNFTDEKFRTTFGMQSREIIETLAGGSFSPSQIREMDDWKEQRFRELIKGKVAPLPGAKQLLQQLTQNNIPIAVGSSAPLANVELTLREADLLKYFQKLVTCEDVSRGKPAPDTFLKAAEKLHTTPKHCAVFEDAIPGVQAAKSAGMTAIAVTTTRNREELTLADLIIDSLDQTNPSQIQQEVLRVKNAR